MSGIFISYRREDTSPEAGRLYDRLAGHFGKDQVFMDIDTIRPGVDFVEVINDSVASCEVLIAVVGKQWLTSTDEAGNRRLDDPEDWIRLEIAAALGRNIRVIPTLVGNAKMPKTNLPEDLAAFPRKQAIEISNSRFHHDVDRLIEAVEGVVGKATMSKPPQGTPIKKAAHLLDRYLPRILGAIIGLCVFGSAFSFNALIDQTFVSFGEVLVLTVTDGLPMAVAGAICGADWRAIGGATFGLLISGWIVIAIDPSAIALGFKIASMGAIPGAFVGRWWSSRKH